jgi:hypothetical protein
MRQIFAATAIAGLASSVKVEGPDWMYKDPWNYLTVTLDGEAHDLFIA